MFPGSTTSRLQGRFSLDSPRPAVANDGDPPAPVARLDRSRTRRYPPAVLRPAALPLALLLALAPTGAAASRSLAADRPVRLSAELGPSWVGSRLDVGPGLAGAARIRVQATPRFLVSGAFVHQVLTLEDGDHVGVNVLPLTVDLRLDRAPVAPFIGGGVAVALVEGLATSVDAALEFGLEIALDERWSVAVQGSYYGLAQAQSFPFFSSITAGIQVGL